MSIFIKRANYNSDLPEEPRYHEGYLFNIDHIITINKTDKEVIVQVELTNGGHAYAFLSDLRDYINLPT